MQVINKTYESVEMLVKKCYKVVSQTNDADMIPNNTHK